MMSDIRPIETFVKSLAFLRREFPRSNDIDDDSTLSTDAQKSHNIYFYDTQILQFFCAPWEHAWGPTTEARLEVGRVSKSRSFLSAGSKENSERARTPGAGEIIPDLSPNDVKDGEDRAIHTLAIL